MFRQTHICSDKHTCMLRQTLIYAQTNTYMLRQTHRYAPTNIDMLRQTYICSDKHTHMLRQTHIYAPTNTYMFRQTHTPSQTTPSTLHCTQSTFSLFNSVSTFCSGGIFPWVVGLVAGLKTPCYPRHPSVVSRRGFGNKSNRHHKRFFAYCFIKADVLYTRNPENLSRIVVFAFRTF